jgi:hypothetical protein
LIIITIIIVYPSSFLAADGTLEPLERAKSKARSLLYRDVMK